MVTVVYLKRILTFMGYVTLCHLQYDIVTFTLCVTFMLRLVTFCGSVPCDCQGASVLSYIRHYLRHKCKLNALGASVGR